MTPCPRCGGQQLGNADRSIMTGTLGLFLMDPKVCMACGYAFDAKAPQMPLHDRTRQVTIQVNLAGGIGMLLIIAALGWFAFYF